MLSPDNDSWLLIMSLRLTSCIRSETCMKDEEGLQLTMHNFAIGSKSESESFLMSSISLRSREQMG